MKAIEPVRAAKMRPVEAAYLSPSRLCANGVEVIDRMVVRHFTQYLLRRNVTVRIQAYKILLFGGQLLQAIHVVGYMDRAVALFDVP